MTSLALIEEKVIYKPDTKEGGRFIPKISVDGKERPFYTDDMCRVLDYTDIKGEEATDGPMLHCESKGETLKFPVRHFCLRGNYLFYFALDDVDDTSSNEITYLGPPLGIIPLNETSVEFPPGGRRVFREHAHTDARNGYEFVIIHAPSDDNGDDDQRPVEFVVAESLNQRERWASAIKSRSEMKEDTLLRPDTGGGGARKGSSASKKKKDKKGSKGGDNLAALDALANVGSITDVDGLVSPNRNKQKKKKRSGVGSATKDRKGGKGSKASDMFNDDVDVKNAIKEFGSSRQFNGNEWIDSYYREHSDFDGPTKCRQLDAWSSSIKKGLKGAVLEQYEYFVEASSEMTIMGREVTLLRSLIESQVETIKEMKEIDFSSSISNTNALLGSNTAGGGVGTPGGVGGTGPMGIGSTGVDDGVGGDDDDLSSVSSSEGKPGLGKTRKEKRKSSKGSKKKSSRNSEYRDEEHYDETMIINIPAWLENDVTEEITAFIKECRYTDATNLIFKAKNEVHDILSQHDKPMIDRKLTRKQYLNMNSILSSIDKLIQNLSNRLVEGLRRKNEALKQAGKRERSDPLSLYLPMVSPTCLSDDSIPLQLLVRLGRHSDAANAYAARRSLLLMEALHERPISGTGTVDLVIYSAQLSQSFFSCLASAVEGFLDLFTQTDGGSGGTGTKLGIDENSLDDSSMQSTILHGGTKHVPPGALSAIVLWCDSELSKFSSAFGGTRILGNLALSPPPRDQQYQQDTQRMYEKSNNSGADDNTKERQNAIEVAAACVDQAFQYASQNLDSIGLPLTPRLAEYIRSRLKGCESEVAKLLNVKWKHLAFDWEFDGMEFTDADQPMDERRAMGGLRAPRQ